MRGKQKEKGKEGRGHVPSKKKRVVEGWEEVKKLIKKSAQGK